MRHGCTWASLMGLSARAVLRAEPPDRHSPLVRGPAIIPEWGERLGVRTIGWWGMTETVSHGIVSDSGQLRRPNAIGRPAPSTASGSPGRRTTPAGPEETGELDDPRHRGLSMFAEYLDKPGRPRTATTRTAGFTGDLVTVHGNGWISFADRAKDMLRVGGDNVAASEIERVIAEVDGVLEAAVVARPDEKLDEVPVAFVLVARGPDPQVGRPRGAGACRRQLADFKVPHQVCLGPLRCRARPSPRSTRANCARSSPPAIRLEHGERRWITEASVDPSGDAD